MNLTALTDDDLDALRVSVLTEQERRRMIAEAPAHAEALAIAYATAVGRKPGAPYQPVTGAHDAYPKGSIVSLSGDYYRATAWASHAPRHDRRTVGARLARRSRVDDHAAVRRRTDPVGGWHQRHRRQDDRLPRGQTVAL